MIFFLVSSKAYSGNIAEENNHVIERNVQCKLNCSKVWSTWNINFPGNFHGFIFFEYVCL